MMVITAVPQGSYIKAAASAVRPWNSIDAISITLRLSEPQEAIDRCLRCECAECWNCIASRRKRAQMRKEVQ